MFPSHFIEDFQSLLDNITNSHDDDEKWKAMTKQARKNWQNETSNLVRPRFKRDHKTQKRIQCAINNGDFYKYFVLIKYRTYGNVYNIRCNVLNTSDLSSDYVYIEVPSSLINANKIEFVINNRENKYNLVLK